MTLKLQRATTWTQKRLKLGMVSSFDPHNMCAKVTRLRQKLDALRVQTGPSLSKYKGFRRKLICNKDISFFWAYFNSRLFLHPTCNIQSQILKIQPFLTTFAIFHAFNDLFLGKPPLEITTHGGLQTKTHLLQRHYNMHHYMNFQ